MTDMRGIWYLPNRYQGKRVVLLAGVGILPVERNIETLLIQVEHALLQALLKFTKNMRLLLFHCVANWGVLVRLPVKEAIHLPPGICPVRN